MWECETAPWKRLLERRSISSQYLSPGSKFTAENTYLLWAISSIILSSRNSNLIESPSNFRMNEIDSLILLLLVAILPGQCFIILFHQHSYPATLFGTEPIENETWYSSKTFSSIKEILIETILFLLCLEVNNIFNLLVSPTTLQ